MKSDMKVGRIQPDNKKFIEIKNEFEQAMNEIKPEVGLKNIEKFKERYQEAFDEMIAFPRLTFGNKKVPKTTAVVNTTSWFLCPGRLQNFCEIKEICYDKCREVMGSACKSRLNHDLWWRVNDAESIGNYIAREINLHNMMVPEKQVNLVRFQEVGEFRNQEDLQKMVDVSNIIYSLTNYKVESYTYTHNKDLDFSIDRPHLCICGSNFMVDNKFSAIPKDEYKEYVKNNKCFECPGACEECSTICSTKLGIEIAEVLRNDARKS